MKLLITGANGQLGRGIIDAGQSMDSLDCLVQAPSEADLDITDPAKVDHVITDLKPDLVINTAAYTGVDKAETEEALAFKINKTGCTHLARTCKNNLIPLIHISTDYVFDGQKGTPYLETDPISPIGVYGRSKAEGEIEIRSILKEHIILRTSWLYGIHGHNFVKTMLGLATGQKEIRVVADQYGSPTNVADLAQTIQTICDHLHSKPQINWGTYHYCGAGVISWHTFSEKIMELTHLHGGTRPVRVKPVTTADYPTRAARPIYSALDCGRIQEHFGISPQPWQKSLEKTIRKLLAIS